MKEKDLKNCILDVLLNKTYREAIKDLSFTRKTGIKSLGTLSYYANKLNVNIKSVYERGVETGRIRRNITYEEWLVLTHRKNVINKNKHIERVEKEKEEMRKKILCELGANIGFSWTIQDIEKDESIIIACLEDFYSKDDIQNSINSCYSS